MNAAEMQESSPPGPTSEKTRLRVAVVDEEFPFPANSGKRIRTLNLMSRLAREHDITYVAHRNADDHELERARIHLEELGINTIEISRRVAPKSGFAFYGKLAANLFSALPYSVVSHTSSEMTEQILSMHSEGGFDLWHCEWTPYAEVFRHINAGPLVIAAHNVESLIWQRLTETESNPIKRWYIRKQWKKYERFERWAFARATQTIAVSPDDARLALEQFGARDVAVVENGVEISRYVTNGDSRRPRELIFLGSLDWRPNLDGIFQFLDRVFPAIVDRAPGTVLRIVGRNPPKWLRDRVEDFENIELIANVPDVIPYLSRAGIMVVPLRIGGGSRLKIIEAAAIGLPVVSTRVGAEGLSLQPGQDFLVAETIDSMDVPILSLIENPAIGKDVSSRARLVAESQYDWDSLSETQSSIWRSIAVGRSEGAQSRASFEHSVR